MKYGVEVFDSEGTIAITDENGDDFFYINVAAVELGPNGDRAPEQRLDFVDKIATLLLKHLNEGDKHDKN
jgi:hypothetical protein